MDTITLGMAPPECNCAQVGSEDYEERSLVECTVYMRMLLRLHPVPKGCNARLLIQGTTHDFGYYREVVVRFDEKQEQAVEYAYNLEAKGPTTWDDIARYELIWLPRRMAFNRSIRSGDITIDDVPQHYRQTEPPELPAQTPLRELMTIHPL